VINFTNINTQPQSMQKESYDFVHEDLESALRDPLGMRRSI